MSEKGENKEINVILSQINDNGRAYFYTKGISMMPMLKEGRDISVLVPPTRTPKRGDVVLFIRKGENSQLVLHRIIRRRDNGSYVIRGDNTYQNEPVKAENVLALLEGFFRKGRYFDCEKSKRYRVYSFFRMFFYPLRKTFYFLPRQAAVKIKHALFG